MQWRFWRNKPVYLGTLLKLKKIKQQFSETKLALTSWTQNPYSTRKRKIFPC